MGKNHNDWKENEFCDPHHRVWRSEWEIECGSKWNESQELYLPAKQMAFFGPLFKMAYFATCTCMYVDYLFPSLPISWSAVCGGEQGRRWVWGGCNGCGRWVGERRGAVRGKDGWVWEEGWVWGEGGCEERVGVRRGWVWEERVCGWEFFLHLSVLFQIHYLLS